MNDIFNIPTFLRRPNPREETMNATTAETKPAEPSEQELTERATELAPKERSGIGAENMAIHWGEETGDRRPFERHPPGCRYAAHSGLTQRRAGQLRNHHRAQADHGDALLQHWMRQLSKAEVAALLTIVTAYPNALSKEQCAATAGYEPNGGGFNNALSRLRTLELINGRGELRASDDLFDSPHRRNQNAQPTESDADIQIGTKGQQAVRFCACV
jgi:hypothetical protein